MSNYEFLPLEQEVSKTDEEFDNTLKAIEDSKVSYVEKVKEDAKKAEEEFKKMEKDYMKVRGQFETSRKNRDILTQKSKNYSSYTTSSSTELPF